ncbi:hypothetical protein AMATHDRAFT_135078 [Amanita thiersii Skay4041]|uniref:Mediator of RNA polymerase II transcription subunit 5 n=1 Tax=Amanita thiersii Skay4041 TaxID=703135 RepID=A0A2A9P1I3_9AGAR|nr:hypothetical protein AMATHDRAFT_135078 [Amanita thiersii Skay4041]
MTLAELTRNCFQSGVSASKWLSLCKLLISKESSIQSSEEIEQNLSSSIIVLYRSYPGDPDLQRYLQCAVESGMISVSVFTATFLAAARSPELHSTTTLHSLCRIAIDGHYASGSSTIIPLTEPLSKTMNTVQDALALLRTAQSLPMSHSHPLVNSASELLILLLSCVTDMSQIPTRQAVVFLSEANELIQSFRLSPDVRHVLESFILSLSLLFGDDAKAATEAQLMHTLHFSGAFNKGDGLSPTADTDIVTFSLILHHLVTYRAQRFGSGSGSDPVALLVGIYRWTSWSPTTFYTQLFIASFACLSQNPTTATIWKAFIAGRLPRLLVLFQDAIAAQNTKIDWRHAVQAAISAAFLRPDLIVASDLALSRPLGSDPSVSDQSFTRDLLLQLVAIGLIDMTFATEKDPGISKDTIPRLYIEARDSNQTLEVSKYLEAKLLPDAKIVDFQAWMERMWTDILSHSTFAQIILKRFSSLTSTYDIDGLSHLCKVLYTCEPALDIVALHVRISDIVFHALVLLDEYDCETVGDPQTAISHLGDIVLFVQYLIARFRLANEEFSSMNERRVISAGFLKRTDYVHPVSSFSGEELVAYNAWYKALFDSSSEGIEDSILRVTKPKTLLRISATLFLQAVRASSSQKIDSEVLNNGVSYFTGPILNWTLLGVVRALLSDIQRRRFPVTPHLEMLQTLLLSPNCPQLVIRLCAHQVLHLISHNNWLSSEASTFNAELVKRAVMEVIGQKNEVSPSPNTLAAHLDQPRAIIRNALAMARSSKGPAIDVERCLNIIPPSKFLEVLWSEAVEAASVGESESCRRITTFILTMPRCATTPPLLPIFVHLLIPVLITRIDKLPSSEQTTSTELLISIISSTLTAALHLEWAVQTVSSEHRTLLGQTSAAMARRLAADLRGHKSNQVGSAIMQRLAASQTFVANFPVFMAN